MHLLRQWDVDALRLCVNATELYLIPGVLVANKCDLDQRRVIHTKAGQEFADANGLEYFECSAVSIVII